MQSSSDLQKCSYHMLSPTLWQTLHKRENRLGGWSSSQSHMRRTQCHQTQAHLPWSLPTSPAHPTLWALQTTDKPMLSPFTDDRESCRMYALPPSPRGTRTPKVGLYPTRQPPPGKLWGHLLESSWSPELSSVEGRHRFHISAGWSQVNQSTGGTWIQRLYPSSPLLASASQRSSHSPSACSIGHFSSSLHL